MKKINTNQIKKLVIDNNYCSGCGICTATKDSPFKMQMTNNGNYIPVNIMNTVADTVCPFANHDTDETKIAQQNFNSEHLKFNKTFGFYKNIYTGYVQKDNYRKNGSSGGSVSWLTHELLQQNLIDYVIHVKENNKVQIRFNYQQSNDFDSNLSGSKSKYYPTTLEASLQFIKNHKARYAIVGIPCFIKGINLLKMSEKVFKDRIKFTIGIFCGHLKTTHYLSALVSQFKLDENKIKHFDFRHKLEGNKPSDYATKIVLHNDNELVKLNKELFGTNWGLGLFKLKSCDYCDDIIAETADISFGDAWIDKFDNEYLGTNMIVVRNEILDKIIKQNINNETLIYNQSNPDELIESQAGGFRHRREGLSYRLYLQEKKGNWTPNKRVKPIKIANKKRRKLYKLRIELQEKSFYSTNYTNPEQLIRELTPLIKKLNNVYKHSLWTRLRLKLKAKK